MKPTPCIDSRGGPAAPLRSVVLFDFARGLRPQAKLNLRTSLSRFFFETNSKTDPITTAQWAAVLNADKRNPTGATPNPGENKIGRNRSGRNRTQGKLIWRSVNGSPFQPASNQTPMYISFSRVGFLLVF